jgi:hypothetical protein
MAPQIEEVPSLAKLPGDTFEAYDYPGGFYEAPDAGSEAILRREVDEVARTPIEVAGNTMGLGVGNLVKLKRPLSLDVQYSPFWTNADFDKEYLICGKGFIRHVLASGESLATVAASYGVTSVDALFGHAYNKTLKFIRVTPTNVVAGDTVLIPRGMTAKPILASKYL